MIRWTPISLLFLVAALSMPVLLHSTSGPVLADARPHVSQEVRDRIHRDGRARVIVRLRLPSGGHVPEGELRSPASVSLQRSDIAWAQSQVLARLVGHAHRLTHRYQTVPFLALDVDADGLAELEAATFDVEQVVEDRPRPPALPQSVPLIQADQAWAKGYDGTGMVVAILDTGVDKTHPFLTNKVVEEACYSSAVPGSSVSVCPNGLNTQTGPGAGVPCTLSACWHGTHVAGIAAGNGAGAGVTFSGVAKGANIMAVQIFSQFNDPTHCGGAPPCVLAWDSDIIAGLERVYTLQSTYTFASVNLSLGGGISSTPCDGEPHKAMIDNLRAAGTATVIAAGNDGSTTAISVPGCISSAVSVGATTKADVVSPFSNVAPFMSLFAPGQNITSSVLGGGFGVASGTSMATPHVAGAFAILKQAAPRATVSTLLTALQQTGVPITDTRGGTGTVRPRIQIAEALATVTAQANAAITTPAAGSTLSSDSVTFTWTAAPDAAEYWIYIGNSLGANDIYTQSQGTNLTGTVTGLPTDGRTLYLRLWTRFGASWQSNDYTYIAARGGPAPSRAQMTSPPSGSTLPGSSVTFTWTVGVGAAEYWIYIGNTLGAQDIYTQSQGTNLSGIITGLPTDGRTLYLRLWTRFGPSWQANDYTYQAAAH